MTPTAEMTRRKATNDGRSQETGIRREIDGGPVTPIAEPARQPADLRMNRIARRAHEIYEARGGEHGKALEDWLLAERQVDAEMEQ
jgi:hypothetical protein